jgi:N-methylhydantoinase B/oxoprolinase/acetone carboxylase alpha subunit
MYKNSSVKCPHCKKLVASAPSHRPSGYFFVTYAVVGTHMLDKGGVCPGSRSFPKSK